MNILILEDSIGRMEKFHSIMNDDGQTAIYPAVNVNEAIAYIQNVLDPFEYIMIDYDLNGIKGFIPFMKKPNWKGVEFARYLSKRGFDGHNVILHTANPVGYWRMKRLLPKAKWAPAVIMGVPFQNRLYGMMLLAAIQSLTSNKGMKCDDGKES